MKTGWRDAPLAFWNLEKTFKHNTIRDSNVIQTHNHLVPKRTLNNFVKLVKWLTCVLSTYLYDIHLNFRYRTCFEKGISWNSGNYTMYIHSEMSTWHDNNIQGLTFQKPSKQYQQWFIIVTVWWPKESEGQVYGIIW